MATNTRLANLIAYKSVLPYASEIFGVYQPLIGWKGKRNLKRFLFKPKISAFKPIEENNKYQPKIKFELIPSVGIFKQRPSKLEKMKDFDKLDFIEYIDAQTSEIKTDVADIFIDYLQKDLVDENNIKNIDQKYLNEAVAKSVAALHSQYKDEFYHSNVTEIEYYQQLNQNLLEQTSKISVTAGYILEQVEKQNFDAVKDIIFFSKPQLIVPQQYIENPFETFDPTRQLQQVGLSPVGVVHLFRQYFYELDTFLGSPVGHVWLSPGSSVEMVESSTRRTLTEQYTEYSTETFQKAETSLTEKDELSEAVKSENESSIKFGANVTAKQKWVWGEASQSASFDLNTTQKTARENAHTQMREQSSKLSAEIRKNYKSTFKTITEITDVSSKRMVLNNTTDKLINYELRRKMRQVAVQVQDIGTYLCWQTFVDYPGNDLGLSTLVHIAEKPNGQMPPPPEEIPDLEPFSITEQITIDCIPYGPEGKRQFDGNALDETYVPSAEHNGRFLKEDNGNEYWIERYHQVKLAPKRDGYKLSDIRFIGNTDVSLSANIDPATSTVYMTIHSIRFRDNFSLTVNAESFWEVDEASDYYQALQQKRKEAQAVYDRKVREESQNAYISAVRERIKLASGVQPRKYEELREEERIVVYRQLIKDLGKQVVIDAQNQQSNKTKEAPSDFHIFYELLNSIFDIDKMLYFVAPEWWKSKPITQINTGEETGNTGVFSNLSTNLGTGLTNSIQSIQVNSFFKKSSTTIPKGNFVTWGVPRPNNYLITEDQPHPAKLGSSLGWLLQLDGDNLRNAFLNSPWVKAVIPIRPGKEKEALNWLKHVEGMNGITEQDMYQGPEEEHRGKSLIQVLEDLAKRVSEKHEASLKSKKFPTEDDRFEQELDPESQEVIDDRNMVSATPVDRVYEHGFYPLQDGFRVDVDKDFQIFDQWVEILPTDQVVPVEVEYDPKTGRQK